jgi:hypothetical protein
MQLLMISRPPRPVSWRWYIFPGILVTLLILLTLGVIRLIEDEAAEQQLREAIIQER